jgi:hypothetical protein
MDRNFIITAILITAGVQSANSLAGTRDLPLRNEPATCVYQASTSQTVENTYGTNLTGLAFSGTATYDFYSPPLASATTLYAGDKGGGTIYMANTSSSHANDFVVAGGIRFYDYDPSCGSHVLLADTGDSAGKNVFRGQSVNWKLPNGSVSADATIPPGHLLHVAVTLTLVSDNPAGFGQLLYNGAQGTSTIAFLTQNNNVVWTFAPPVLPNQCARSICLTDNGCAKVSCAGFPNQTYVIQATSSLSNPNWITIATNTAGADGLFSFVDSDTRDLAARFYRTANP